MDAIIAGVEAPVQGKQGERVTPGIVRRRVIGLKTPEVTRRKQRCREPKQLKEEKADSLQVGLPRQCDQRGAFGQLALSSLALCHCAKTFSLISLLALADTSSS